MNHKVGNIVIFMIYGKFKQCPLVYNVFHSVHSITSGLCAFLILGADKVSMLTYPYTQQKTRGILKWPSVITRLTSHVTCGLMCSGDLQVKKKIMVIHDTECPN